MYRAYKVVLGHGHVGSHSSLEFARIVLARSSSEAFELTMKLPRVKKQPHHLKLLKQIESLKEAYETLKSYQLSNPYKDKVPAFSTLVIVIWLARAALQGRLKLV